MTIDEWRAANAKKTWKVRHTFGTGMLTAEDVVSVHGRLDGEGTTATQASVALITHSEVKSVGQYFGAVFATDVARKLATKALNILVADGVLKKPTSVRVWRR